MIDISPKATKLTTSAIARVRQGLSGEAVERLLISAAFLRLSAFRFELELLSAPKSRGDETGPSWPFPMLLVALIRLQEEIQLSSATGQSTVEMHDVLYAPFEHLLEAYDHLVRAATCLPGHEPMHFVQVHSRPLSVPTSINDTEATTDERERMLAVVTALNSERGREATLAPRHGPTSLLPRAARRVWEVADFSTEMVKKHRALAQACLLITEVLEDIGLELDESADPVAAVRMAIHRLPS